MNFRLMNTDVMYGSPADTGGMLAIYKQCICYSAMAYQGATLEQCLAYHPDLIIDAETSTPYQRKGYSLTDFGLSEGIREFQEAQLNANN